MCKHVLNAQVSVRAPCCKKWYDCPECHDSASDHKLRKVLEIVMACKKCKKVFRKDMSDYEESDEYCPHCDNLYVIEAKIPKMGLGIESEDPRIQNKFLKDSRIKPKQMEYTDL